MASIAGNLEPSLLGRSASASDGAPITGPDGVVESGNGRVLALRRVYQAGGAPPDRYRAFLESQGFETAGVKQPVLVRVRTTHLPPADRATFAREANARTTLSMSATEQAGADAAAIPDRLVELYRGGDLEAAGNRDFVRRFVEHVIPASERGAVIAPEGALSVEGRRRIENAIFAKTFGAPDILQALRESGDSNIRSIGEALVETAPGFLDLRNRVAGGQVAPGMDIGKNVTEAARFVADARRRGMTVADALAQHDAFAEPITPIAERLLRLFFADGKFKRPASRQRIVDSLRYFVDQASKADTSAGLFIGDAAPPASAEQILDRAGKAKTEDLFAASRQPPASARRVVMDAEMPADGTVGSSGGKMDPGANYVGFVRDQVHAAVARRGGIPFRRESIIADLAKALGKPIYFGRIKSKMVGGFYRPKLGEVRIKKRGDIEVTAHEIAHFLDDTIPEIRQQWVPATKANEAVRAELAGVSYDKTKLYEGFAEFVRLWATQPHEAAARAPIFNGWFEDFVSRAKQGPALRRMQVQMTDWFSQNAIDRATSKIGEGVDVNGFLSNLRRTFRQSTVDDFEGFRQYELGVTDRLAPAGSRGGSGVYETARLTRAAAAMIEGSIRYGRLVVRPDGSHGYEGKSLVDILDPVAGNLEDALRYFVGKSAAETFMQGRENLFTKAEIQAMLGLQTPERATAWQEFKDWQAGALDFAQAKGAIDPAARAAWRRAEYLPFFRVQAGGGSAKSNAPVGDWHGIRALKGGTGNIKDVMQNILRNQHMLIEAGLMNEARQKAFLMMRQPGAADFMAKIGTDSKVVTAMKDEVAKAIMRGFGKEMSHRVSVAAKEAARKGESVADAVAAAEAGQPDSLDFEIAVDDIISKVSPLLQIFVHGQSPKGNNVVAALFEGKPQFAEVIDPVLMRAMAAMQRPGIDHPILKALNAVRRVGQSSVTLALDFMAANWGRDQLMAGIFSRAGYKPFLDGAKGLVSRMKSDPAYRDYIANGGGIASQMRDEASVRRHIARYYGDKGLSWRTVMDTPAKMLEGLERIAESFEAATRIQEYKRAVAQGEHPRHAAYLSREVSTDWAMRGDSKALGVLYDSVLFLKAAAVSMDRVYRGVVHDPNKGKIMAWTAAMAAFSAVNYLNNRHRKDYQQMTDAERDIYWHFYVPTPELLHHIADTAGPLPAGPHGEEQGWLHLKFPKIWEVGAVASIAERELEGILTGRPGEAQANVARVLWQLFSINPIPQVLRPIAEAAMNTDLFTGSPIVPKGLEDVQPYARATPTTSTAMRKLGMLESGLPASLQVSPAQAEHLLRGYLNSWADYGLRLIDGIAFDDAPHMRLDQAPVIRRFYGEQPRLNSRYVDELYQMVGAADQVRATARFMTRTFSPEQAQAELRKPEVAQGIALKGAGKVLGGYRRQIEEVLRAHTVEELRKLAELQSRIAPDPGFMMQAQAPANWNSLPRLKTLMRDRLVAMRNQFAEREVKQLGGH